MARGWVICLDGGGRGLVLFKDISTPWSFGSQTERKEVPMSQHRSLKGSGKITSKRNVLKRFERINLLIKRGQWKEGDRGQGLRKTMPEA